MVGLCFAFAGIGVATIGWSEPVYDSWTFKDWTVLSAVEDTVQDRLVTCTAASSGRPTLSVNVVQFNLDAGPPDAYPAVYLTRTLGDGRVMALSDTDLTVTLVFDGGNSVPAILSQPEGAKPFDFAIDPKLAQGILAAMRRSSVLTVRTEFLGDVSISLSGFTASYLKMSELCGFSTEGVL